MSGPSAFIRRFTTLFNDEFQQLRPLDRALDLASRLVPVKGGNQARVSILRARGILVGEETILFDTPDFSGGESRGSARLSIGDHCVIEIGCTFDLGDTITIGNRVTLGQGIMILTTTHEASAPAIHRAGAVVPRSVQVHDGGWERGSGARAMILPRRDDRVRRDRRPRFPSSTRTSRPTRGCGVPRRARSRNSRREAARFSAFDISRRRRFRHSRRARSARDLAALGQNRPRFIYACSPRFPRRPTTRSPRSPGGKRRRSRWPPPFR